jgi:signal transduction histidine kinase
MDTEAEALERERARANQSLSAARALFLSAGAFGLVATVVMAVVLARRLRQPLHHLDTGLRAYRAGDFTYRFNQFRDTEFIKLGRQLNEMADEVERARTRAAQNRAELEQNVAARTAELRQSVDELAASEAARQRLLADVGHELRTPVTVIRGEAQVALRAKQPRVQVYRAALERIVEVSRQMGHLIEDLLVLVRDPAGRPAVVPVDTTLAAPLAQAIETARVIAAQREVSLHIPDVLPDIQLRADPARLRQVLTCLLDNAVRYSNVGGHVTLAVRQEDARQIAIEITDEGIGIAKADLDLAFQRGWRSDTARAHRPDGLGLGLAIARQLTQEQGGRLEIANRPEGTGTRAVLHMPVGAPIAPKEQQWKSS